MEKYTLYYFRSDNEGGYGICYSDEWSPRVGYEPWTGWRARPSEFVGNFNTAEELADLTDGWLSIEEAKEMIADVEGDVFCTE